MPDASTSLEGKLISKAMDCLDGEDKKPVSESFALKGICYALIAGVNVMLRGVMALEEIAKNTAQGHHGRPGCRCPDQPSTSGRRGAASPEDKASSACQGCPLTGCRGGCGGQEMSTPDKIDEAKNGRR
ncbi:MAG: hypothetical protein WC797_03800 [Candidatus Paceibacterota bacterium]|jgi:hypothetical protein